MSMRFFLCLFLTLLAAMANAAEVRVMTFNVRYDNPGDGGGTNSWVARGVRVAQAIVDADADIVGTQEVLHHQYADLCRSLSGYEVLGCGRDDGDAQGEYAALFFKRSRFDCLRSGNFWLSDTPEIAGSKGWDGACVRMATWALLCDKQTGDTLIVLNTHLDHEGEEARRNGVELIMRRVKELASGAACIVTGDFNATPKSEPIELITDNSSGWYLIDTRTAARQTDGPEWTFHNFGRLSEPERSRIDYIFVSPRVEVTQYATIDNSTDAPLTYSDHCPVIVTLKP